MILFKTVIELGCHYQDTVLDMPETLNADVYMVDAVREFLDLLPNSKNLHKICAAVTPDFTGVQSMRGITLETQKNNNLPAWSTTMNSLVEGHPTITKFAWDHLASNFNVNCYSVEDLWQLYNLPKNVDFLATDLEGLDYQIINKIFDLGITAEIIRFESKLMSSINLENLIKKLCDLNYTVTPGTKIDYNNMPYNHWAYKGTKPNFELS